MAMPFKPSRTLNSQPDAQRNALERLFVADAVLATKASHTAPVWLTGRDRSLWHNSWLICTSDLTLVRGNELNPIRFDAAVGYGGVSLADPSLAACNVTKKILVSRGLTVGLIKGPLTSATVCEHARYFDWFVRWRLGRGIERNDLLGPEDFENFKRDLAADDVLSLVPIEARLRLLADEVRSGKRAFPRKGDQAVDWIALANLLGVTRYSLSSSPRFRSALRAMISDLGLPDGDNLLASVADAKPREEVKSSSRTHESYLVVWSFLYRLSEAGWLAHDPLRFDPFKEKPLHVVAAEIGRAAERTRTLHPEDLGNLLAAASKWIVVYADYVISAYVAMVSLRELHSAAPRRSAAQEDLDARLRATAPVAGPVLAAHWTRRRMERGDTALSLNEAVRHLLVAAGIVIAGMSARRRKEVESLQSGCVTETMPGVWVLFTYIAKNLRAEDMMPVPSLVAKAVEVLERLSEPTRAITGKEWLFEIMGNGGSHVPIEWSDALNTFARMMELPLPRGWSEWRLAFHQLRRGFSIAYYWGFRLSSLDALSHQLWHLDPSVTRVYVFETIVGAILPLREEIASRTRKGLESLTPEKRRELDHDRQRLEDLQVAGEAWDEGRCEFVAHKLLQMWAGTEFPAGKGGRRLFGAVKELARGLIEAVRIGSRANDPDAEVDEFVARAKQWARSNFLEPVPGVPVHCLCRHDHPDDLEDAECLKAKRGYTAPSQVDPEGGGRDRIPDMAFASTYVCLHCSHCAAFSDDRQEIRTTLQRLAAAVRKGVSPAVRDEARLKHGMIESALVAAENGVSEFMGVSFGE